MVKKIDNISGISYEDAIARLEKINFLLEDPSTKLTEINILYEEGICLIKHCEEMLDSIEQQMEVYQ
jgi:exodeoxyribonuclease VII small subunit